MSQHLVRPRTCGNCAHRFVDEAQQIQCRRYPPHTQPLIARGPQGPVISGHVTMYPIVAKDSFCGEHRSIVMDEEIKSGGPRERVAL